MNTALILGGPLDGQPLVRFPDGEYHKNADGWPLALDAKGEPIAGPTAPSPERYFPLAWPRAGSCEKDLFYIWQPYVAAWYGSHGQA